MNIAKGALFVLTEGEYSDYQMMVVCRATEDIDPQALTREYLAAYPQQAEDYDAEFYHFAKWLTVDRQAAEEAACWEWHLGEYGTFRPELKTWNERHRY